MVVGEPVDAVGWLYLRLGRRAEPAVGGSWTNCGHVCLSGPLTWTAGGPAEELQAPEPSWQSGEGKAVGGEGLPPAWLAAMVR